MLCNATGCVLLVPAGITTAVTAAAACIAATNPAGETIRFSLGCQNTRNLNVNVTSFSVMYSGATTATAVCDTAALIAPGASCAECFASYQVTQDDLDRGYVKASATLNVLAPWQDTSKTTACFDYEPSVLSTDSKAAQAPYVAIEQASSPAELPSWLPTDGECVTNVL